MNHYEAVKISIYDLKLNDKQPEKSFQCSQNVSFVKMREHDNKYSGEVIKRPLSRK